MARFTKEEQAVLRKLLDEEDTGDGEVETEAEPESEEFVVFRGSADAFFKAFGVTPPVAHGESGEASEVTEKPKEEPKAKSRSKYFG